MKSGLFSILGWLALLAAPASAIEIIPARFERGMPFREGLAAVSIGGRVGYVDERGDFLIEPRFDLAGEFAHGLAEVLIGDQVGSSTARARWSCRRSFGVLFL